MMGKSFICKCNQCNNEIKLDFGVGFLFPALYMETVEAMKNGERGEQAAEFFKLFPDGAIDYDRTIAKCASCGEIFEVDSMNMYVLKEGHTMPDSTGQTWSVEAPFTEVNYVTGSDLRKHYRLYEKYKYSCPKCGSSAKTIRNADNYVLKNGVNCSKCGKGRMEVVDLIRWD